MNLFGPERVRGAFGVIYEIERLGYVDDRVRGRLLEARFRKPGEQTWDVGLFELAKLQELPPTLSEPETSTQEPPDRGQEERGLRPVNRSRAATEGFITSVPSSHSEAESDCSAK